MREQWEKQPWEERGHWIWDEHLKTPGWPEHGDGRISVEALYSHFRERLMAELVAQGSQSYEGLYGEAARRVDFPLVSKESV